MQSEDKFIPIASGNLERRPFQILLVVYCVWFALGLVNGFYKEWLFNLKPVLFWIADVIQFVVIPAVLYLFVIKLANIKPAQLGFRVTGPFMSALDFLLLSLLCSFLFWLVYEVGSILGSRFESATENSFGYSSVVPETITLKVIAVLYLSITAAVIEETVFRSIPWLLISERVSENIALVIYIVCSSVCFGLIHWENGFIAVIVTAMVGILACFLYVRIRNIWPLIIAHFTTDAIVFW